MAATKWGDSPLSLSGMSHNSSQVRAATQQFLSVPISTSAPIASTRRTVCLRFVSDGDLVTVSGPLAPMDEYLYDYQALLNDATTFLADPDNLKKFQHPEKYLLKRGHQVSEIVNRLRIYLKDAFDVKLGPDTIHQLGEFLTAGEVTIQSKTAEPTQCVPTPSKIMDGSQTLSTAPGRLDEEEYNAGRAKFLTHQVYDLTTSMPGLSSFIKEYYEVIPTSTDGAWDTSQRTGLLIRAPAEELESQTTFSMSWKNSVMMLTADEGTVVASFDVHDIDRIAPEHHKCAQSERTKGHSFFSKLTATKHGVVFFTAEALRWMIDHGCTDSVVSTRDIRVCIGFDPVVARWTRDGFVEAAMLMDDKLSSIGQQRMVKRVLAYMAPAPTVNLIHGMLVTKCKELRDQYRVSTHDRFGLDTVAQSTLSLHSSDAAKLKAEIQSLKDKLANVSQQTSLPASPSNSRLLAKISELQRLNKELLLRHTDLATPKPSQLDAYLRKHVCVNCKDFELDLLRECGLDDRSATELMSQRANNRSRFETRLEGEVRDRMKPELDKLHCELDAKDEEIDTLTSQVLDKQQELDEMEARLSQLEQELRETRNRALQLNAENARLSSATKTSIGFVSDSPPDTYQAATSSMDALVDSL
ncbi:Viral factory protein [Corvid orthoreovirus]|nr:Viral factory protein [Corvid orthoreovirus]